MLSTVIENYDYSDQNGFFVSRQGLHPRIVTEGFDMAKAKALEVSISFMPVL